MYRRGWMLQPEKFIRAISIVEKEDVTDRASDGMMVMRKDIELMDLRAKLELAEQKICTAANREALCVHTFSEESIQSTIICKCSSGRFWTTQSFHKAPVITASVLALLTLRFKFLRGLTQWDLTSVSIN